MLSGKTPYKSDSALKLLMMHLTHPIPDILTNKPELPSECDVIIKRALAKNPADRYQSVSDLSRDLSRILPVTI
jgi:serine/threonine protein kinase